MLEAVLDSTDTDDTMCFVIDEKTGIQLYNELSELWQLDGMYPRKSLSNYLEVLKILPETYCAEPLKLDSGKLPSVTTLAIVWKASLDLFTSLAVAHNENATFTKQFLF